MSSRRTLCPDVSSTLPRHCDRGLAQSAEAPHTTGALPGKSTITASHARTSPSAAPSVSLTDTSALNSPPVYEARDERVAVKARKVRRGDAIDWCEFGQRRRGDVVAEDRDADEVVHVARVKRGEVDEVWTAVSGGGVAFKFDLCRSADVQDIMYLSYSMDELGTVCRGLSDILLRFVHRNSIREVSRRRRLMQSRIRKEGAGDISAACIIGERVCNSCAARR